MTSQPHVTLTDSKRQLLAVLRDKVRLAPAGGPAPLPQRVPGERIPLSHAQQRLWFVEQLAGPSAVYNIAGSVRLSGALDEARLGRALDAVVARHEGLRTALRDTGSGRPEQVIADDVRVDLRLDDLSDMALDEAEARSAAIALADGSHVFDLAVAPLMRVRLIRIRPDEHRLIIVIHHIIADGWSLDLFVRDLGTAYTGRLAALSALSRQYADYAIWQRDHLSGPVLDAEIDEYCQALAGAPVTVALPADRSPAARTTAGALRWDTLPPEISRRLAALAATQGATRYAALVASLAALLYSYRGQDDMVIAVPSANRAHPQTHDMIGFFVNMLPVRVDLRGRPDFRTLLNRTKDRLLEAYQHQDVPFERIIERMRPDRRGGASPYADVVLVHEGAEWSRADLGALDWEIEPVDTGLARFDLFIQASEKAGGLRLLTSYSTDLFTPSAVEGLIADWQDLISAACADPDAMIETLLPRPRLGRGTAEESASADHDRPAFVAPATPTEQALAAIWERMFAIDAIGRDDSFFDLGGHSMLVVQLIQEIRESLGRDIPMRAVFVGPELRELAAAVDEAPAVTGTPIEAIERATVTIGEVDGLSAADLAAMLGEEE